MSRRPSTASGALEHKPRFSREQDIPLPSPLFTKPPAEPEVEPSRPKPKRGARNHDDSSPDHLTLEDRMVLAELAQRTTPRHPFVYKNGKKHHPYSHKDIPYPRSYERSILDHEIWEDMVFQQMLGGLTYYHFETPPARVLDLGCGTGAWILNAARQWKDTHFFGLDIVPLYPDLKRIGMHELAKRITWVQASFLEQFPFPDGYFDFVRVQRLSRCLPEDKVQFFCEEAVRVLKRGGVFQTIDEDLYFPGSAVADEDVDTKPSPKLKELPSSETVPKESTPSTDDNGTVQSHAQRQMSLQAEKVIPRFESSDSLHSDVSSGLEFANTNTYTGSSDSFPEIDREDTVQRSSTYRSYTNNGTISSQGTKVRRRSLSVARGDGVDRDGQDFEPLPGGVAPYREGQHHIFGDDTTLANSSTISSYEASSKDTLSKASAVSHSRNSLSQYPEEDDFPPPWLREDDAESSRNSSGSLYHPSMTQPLNPRDHTLLERIYREMHAARFINLSPLSVQASSMNIFFSPVYTHPPIMLTFPPRPRKTSISNSLDSYQDELDFLLPTMNDHESGYAVIQLAQKRVRSSRKHGLATAGAKDSKARDDVAAHYVLIDDARLPSKAPQRPRPRVNTDSKSNKSHASSDRVLSPLAQSSRSTFSLLTDSELSTTSTIGTPHSAATSVSKTSSIKGTKGSEEKEAAEDTRASTPATSPISPKKTKVAEDLEIDLKTLHLHLALRVADTLGCAESMWEWVLEEQGRYHSMLHRHRIRGLPPPSPPDNGSTLEDAQMDAIRKMTRADFDSCLQRFKLDMQDKTAIDHALDMHLHLRPRFKLSHTDSDRRGFDLACAAWDAGIVSDIQGVNVGGSGGASDGATMGSGAQSLLEQHAKFLSRSLRVIACRKPDWA